MCAQRLLLEGGPRVTERNTGLAKLYEDGRVAYPLSFCDLLQGEALMYVQERRPVNVEFRRATLLRQTLLQCDHAWPQSHTRVPEMPPDGLVTDS